MESFTHCGWGITRRCAPDLRGPVVARSVKLRHPRAGVRGDTPINTAPRGRGPAKPWRAAQRVRADHMGILRSLAAALLLTCEILGARSAWSAPTPAQVEAVFLFNFSQFVDWPRESYRDERSALVIGVLGTDPFGATLDQVVQGESVNGRALTVQRFRRVEDVSDCQILFISRSERERLPQILQSLKGRSILTVSDMEEFAQNGGMIRFVTVENKIRLHINVDAARAAGLTISSKLLRPAQIISARQG